MAVLAVLLRTKTSSLRYGTLYYLNVYLIICLIHLVISSNFLLY